MTLAVTVTMVWEYGGTSMYNQKHNIDPSHRHHAKHRSKLEAALEQERLLLLEGKPVPRAIATAKREAQAEMAAAATMDAVVPCFKCGLDVNLRHTGAGGSLVSLRQVVQLNTGQLHYFDGLTRDLTIALCWKCDEDLQDYATANEAEIDAST